MIDALFLFIFPVFQSWRQMSLFLIDTLLRRHNPAGYFPDKSSDNSFLYYTNRSSRSSVLYSVQSAAGAIVKWIRSTRTHPEPLRILGSRLWTKKITSEFKERIHHFCSDIYLIALVVHILNIQPREVFFFCLETAGKKELIKQWFR